MADFRKWLFAFALIALIVGAGTANAQVTPGQAFTCVANAGNPVLVRVEGLTELIGDLLLQCTGGTPTVAGVQVPVSNISLTLNTNITSRLLGGGYIDALLLIDEPWPTTANPQNVVTKPANTPAQRVCQSVASPTTSSCNYLVGTGGGGYGSITSPYVQTGASTVYVGRPTSISGSVTGNQVTWLGVPVDAPGTTGQTRILRITNVRANACQLGLSSTLIPTQIVGYIAITGSQFITINNPQQTLAYIQQGLLVSGPNVNLSQCNNLNVGGAGGNGGNFFGGAGTGRAETAIVVREGFAASFKRAVYTGSANTITALTGPSTANGLPQNIPGFAYNTESALNPDATPGTASGYGLASFGTRILIRFNNVSQGVRLVLPLYVPLTIGGTSPGTTQGNPIPATSGFGGWTGGFLQLIGSTSDVNGNIGTFAPTSTTAFNGSFNSGISNPFGGGAYASQFYAATEIPVNAGFATAVYEVVNTDPSAIEQASIPVGVAFVSNTASNLPSPTVAPATGTQVSFAPLSTVGTASSSDPIPRFCDRSTANSSFGITVCTCNLLFPFVTQAAGFDTGIAIANTTADPFGTAAQTGPVTMWFYGSMAGGGAVPGALAKQVTTGNVPAGNILTWTAFGGAGQFGAGLSAMPGFTGYMIAQAQFQFCHGFAFITKLGAVDLAEGYLAIQLDAYGGTGLNRTGILGEVQGH